MPVRIRNLFLSFFRREDGNIAMMASIAMVVVVGAIALSIDTSKGINNKSRLGDATDAIALFLAQSGLETQSELEAAANKYLAEKYPGDAGAHLKILSIKKEGKAVTVKMANISENTFGSLLGDDKRNVSVAATAVWSQRALDMVLVLDTTLSMEGTRLASLKSSATDMLNTIESYDNDNFRIAVVPFSNYVNVGVSRRYKNWMSVPSDTSETTNVCRNKRDVTSTSNCRSVSGSYDRDGVSVPYTRQQCDYTYGPEYEVCGPRTVTEKWYGCVGSRDEPYDLRTNVQGRKFPGLMNMRCGAELQEMTTSLAAARSTISSLTAVGNTYMPSGLMWGWRALSPRNPLRHTVDPDIEKVLVLMTDGENTRSKNGDWHEATAKADADDKTRQICEAVKDEEIIVYTIAYEVTDSSTQSLLENCASGQSRYFNAQNSAELNSAFEEIAASLNDLRISA